jgi:iron-sulfur cluster repair protein YtfE (RIC family)
MPEPLAGLIREHRVIEEVVNLTRDAIGQAAAHPGDSALVGEGLDRVLDLDAFLQEDLARHIAKEEQVLFPAVRDFNAETELAVDDMLAQHDEVRERQRLLERALAAVDGHHDEVQDEQARLTAALKEAGSAPSHEMLIALRESVRHLDTILQGHFGDEEDGLFGPVSELLTAEELAALANAMAAIDSQG